MGWATATVGELLDIVRGVTFPSAAKTFHPQPNHIACLRTANVQRDVEWDDLWFIPEGYVKREEQVVRASDILISTANSYELVGKVARVKHIPFRATLGAFISLIRSPHVLDAGYVYFLLSSYETQTRIRDMASTTTNISNVSTKKLQTLPLKIPPAAEQRRIVAAIEEQFSRLDAGVAALKWVRANLKRYRTAVLKAAVEGRLTEPWRGANPDVESASELLERVLKERRERWVRDQRAAYEKKGKKPPKNWRLRYKEPAGPDTEALPDLPQGWCWTSVEQLGEVIGGLTKNQKRASLPLRLPYLRVANVYADELRLDEIEEIGVGENELGRVLLQEGDLLVVEGNGSPDQIGRVALWDASIEPCVHQNHLIKVRFVPQELGKLVLHWLLSISGREHIKRVASSTSGLYTLSISKVQALPVPLPPLAEQEEIVSEIERRLSILREVEAEVEANLKRASRLRQSILKRAFEGKLVRQDPSDEPASELLARIQREREQASSKKPKRRTKEMAAAKVDPAGHAGTLF